MSLIELHPDFSAIREQLTRIADALDRAFPPPVSRDVLPVTRDDVIQISDAQLWEKEQEEEAKNARK
jgi:hypothetical protein